MDRLKHSEFVYYLCLPFIWLYTYPKWSSEVECIGFQKCTPTGAWVHSIAVVLGYVGGAILFVCFVAALWGRRSGWYFLRRFGIGMVCASATLGLAGWILYAVSRWLAIRRGFKYDHDTNVASWDENGRRVTYDHEMLRKELRK